MAIIQAIVDALQFFFFAAFFLFAFDLLSANIRWPGAVAGLIALVIIIQAVAGSRKPVA